MLFHQLAGKAIVPSRNRRVRGEGGLAGNFAQRVAEGQAIVVHPLANDFERPESAVSFVEVIDTGTNAKSPQGFHPADAENQLLTDAGSLVAAIETRSQLAVLGTVAVDVAVEQIELDAA